MSPDIAGGRLSAEVTDIQAFQFGLGHVFKQSGTILTFALLDPMPVDAESTSIYHLELKTKNMYEMTMTKYYNIMTCKHTFFHYSGNWWEAMGRNFDGFCIF